MRFRAGVGERERDVVGRDVRAADRSFQHAPHHLFGARDGGVVAAEEQLVAVRAHRNVERGLERREIPIVLSEESHAVG